MLTEEIQAPAVVPQTKLSPKQKKVSPKPPKKEDFSDGNDIDDASTEELQVETVELLDYNHEQQGTLLTTGNFCNNKWIILI